MVSAPPLSPQSPNWKRISVIALISVIGGSFLGGLLYAYLFGPPSTFAAPVQFLVRPDESVGQAASDLEKQGIVRSALILELAYHTESKRGMQMRPGGYTLSASMDVWTVATTLAEPPGLAWVTIPGGVRKEEIADLLQETLGWTDAEKQEWVTVDTVPSGSLADGDLYPDVYLIPADQSPAEVAARMRGRFADQTAALAKQAAVEHLKWTNVLTLASIVEREAGKTDKPLVAGILENRLKKGMLLQTDDTLQYAKGHEGNWWPAVTGQDKYLNSPFNTYAHTGLPPHPIAEPSLASIAAVLNPQKTSCLYYLHDANHIIHCSANYAGHEQNVNAYLK